MPSGAEGEGGGQPTVAYHLSTSTPKASNIPPSQEGGTNNTKQPRAYPDPTRNVSTKTHTAIVFSMNNLWQFQSK